MRVLLIDNFDSFTYNLYQHLGEMTDVTVVRNNKIPFERIESGEFSHIVISPGPGNPADPAYFGDTAKVISRFYEHIPILGICLGHQGIAAVLGGKIIKAPSIMHGKTSTLEHNGKGLLKGLPEKVMGMRYHSLTVDKRTIPKALIVDAIVEDGSVMAFHHSHYPVFGIQFHPESFRTELGKKILKNFLKTGEGV